MLIWLGGRMKKKQYLLYSMIGLLIVVLSVVLIVLLVSDGGEEVQNDQNSNDSEFVLPSDGDYSKYESDYNEIDYDLQHDPEIDNDIPIYFEFEYW